MTRPILTALDKLLVYPVAVAIVILALTGCLGPGEGREIHAMAANPTKPIPTGAVALVDKPQPATENPDIPLPEDLQAVLMDALGTVPLPLVLAVMEHESGFDPNAIGWDGHDFGLFQLRDSNHQWLADETGADPMTPYGNIICGVWMLGYLMDKQDTTEAALTAYRYGYDNGTRDYAKSVLSKAEAWEAILKGC